MTKFLTTEAEQIEQYNTLLKNIKNFNQNIENEILKTISNELDFLKFSLVLEVKKQEALKKFKQNK